MTDRSDNVVSLEGFRMRKAEKHARSHWLKLKVKKRGGATRYCLIEDNGRLDWSSDSIVDILDYLEAMDEARFKSLEDGLVTLDELLKLLEFLSD
jgi:hypothetical protein